MTEQDIADYLKNHPDFFTHRPELLQQLSIPHSHEEGTISLVEAQLAHQEADIFFALLPLQKKLFQTEDFIAINEKLDDWAKGYELEGAKILLFTDSWQKNSTIPEQHWLDRKAFELIRLERMGLRQFYLGDLSNKEKALMFLPEELPIGSVAICRLGGTPQKPTALLLFKSRDTDRFHNDQDTTFLRHLVDIVELHLGRWL